MMPASRKSAISLQDTRELLVDLVHRIPFISASQLASYWPQCSPVLRRALIAQLEGSRFVVARRYLMEPELLLSGPLVEWSDGDPEPDYRALAYRLKSRSRNAPIPTIVYLATSLGTRFIGGIAADARRNGKLRAPFQATHDLHCTQIYLRFRKEHPALAARWVSESWLKRLYPSEKVTDAAILDNGGAIRLAVEFGGSSYREGRLRSIHEMCTRRKIPYQIW